MYKSRLSGCTNTEISACFQPLVKFRWMAACVARVTIAICGLALQSTALRSRSSIDWRCMPNELSRVRVQGYVTERWWCSF